MQFINMRNLITTLLKITLRLPIGAYKRVEETSQFNEYFIKSYNNDSDEE